MTERDLGKIHDLLVSIAEKAGWMITTANPSTVDTKKNCKRPRCLIQGGAVLVGTTELTSSLASDLVTETDKAVEKMVFETLRAEHPTYT